jgi:uncharacterized repeat protein (TIGR03806 family)
MPGLDTIQRGAASALFPSELQLGGHGWNLIEAFPNVFFDVATTLSEAPGTQHLFITQQNGLIYALSKAGGGEGLRVVLDLRSTTQGGSDCGLLGLAFHPEFNQPSSPNRGFMYVHRAFSEAPIQPQGAPVYPFTRTASRLSRFTVDLDSLVADPASEQILIEQQDEGLWHQGGALFFHPEEGFLYVSVGDEGEDVCRFGNCQRIDKDLFSGVLRIDVDQRGGSISHPIPRQPESGVTANYYIPNDNPFVGQPGVLEEFYALGLRSPHRMTYDVIDRLGLIGDVGQLDREEIDVLAPGANYQWNVLEGRVVAVGLEPMPVAPIGIWTDPVLELQRQEAASVIGGYVYRGSRFPELWGKYIFGDFSTGNIWAVSYDYDGVQFRILERELLLQGPPGLASFGVDAEGELYLLHFGIHPIRKLERLSGQANVPARLSELGLFDTRATPAGPDTLLPYVVQSPLWSDGAHKERWIALPEEGDVSFAEDGAWGFPEGTVLVKHFSMAFDERTPAQRRPLETRFLVHGATRGYYGVTYKWNAEGTDAELLRERRVEMLTIIGPDGHARQQRYTYPSPTDCLICHNEEAGYVLGPRTAQLNAVLEYAATGRRSNQLLTWSALGLFGESLVRETNAEILAAFPQLAALDDESRSLEDRVRSYWEGNCSMCHGVKHEIRAYWDARYSTPLLDQGVLWAAPYSGDVQDEAVIWPGEPTRSVLFSRSSTIDPNRKMPPLGRNRVDERYVEVLRAWIESLEESVAP